MDTNLVVHYVYAVIILVYGFYKLEKYILFVL